MKLRLGIEGVGLSLVAWMLMASMLAIAAAPLNGQAQSVDPLSGDSLAWRLRAGGRAVSWSPPDTLTTDSLRRVSRLALQHLRQQGYYHAELDSAHIDTSAHAPRGVLYATRGPRVRVGEVHLRGTSALQTSTLRQLMETRPGKFFDPEVLETDLRAILQRYDEAGYPLAQVRVSEVALSRRDSSRLQLTLRIQEGEQLLLNRVALEGASRTSPSYVARLARLKLGQPMQSYDAASVQRRLRETALFQSVGEPELRVVEGEAVLVVPVEEEPPGNFDLVLGYLPASENTGGGQLIGSGHLLLRNLFGHGRTASLQLDKRPGAVSRVDARVGDPFVLGFPIGAEAQFSGLQQDSTYGQQEYGLELSYRLSLDLRATMTVRRTVTQPGRAGVALGPGGEQRIPRSQSWFVGLGMRYQNLDRLVSPHRGVTAELRVERGDKSRSARRIVAGDTTRQRSALRQDRIVGEGRLFVPTFARQVFMAGVDGSVLLSDEYDRSDLFRFGGATSLRGYDEDRFRGHIVGRLLAEYRFLLDRVSFAYGFADLGFVARPALSDGKAERGWHLGYGLGVQFETNVGLINASYALNEQSRSPANGRVHVGLSLGL